MKFSCIKHKREFQGIRNCISKEFIGISLSIIQWGIKIMPPRTRILYIQHRGGGDAVFLTANIFHIKIELWRRPPSHPFLGRCKKSKWKYGFKQEKSFEVIGIFGFGSFCLSRLFESVCPPPLKNDATLPVWWRKGVFVIHTNTPRRSQVVIWICSENRSWTSLHTVL